MTTLAPHDDNTESPRFPIFIIGSPRSGTSMLHWALCEHQSLWGSEESALFLQYTRHLDEIYRKARQFEGRNWLQSQAVDRNEFFAHLGRGIEALYASRADGRHWVEQTPSNTWALPDIQRLLPDARFLFIHRDGRQVVESMKSMWHWRITKAAKTWTQANRLAVDFEHKHPRATLRICYEKLVQDTESELLRIWQFLGLEPCPASFRFIVEKQPINASPQHQGQGRLQKLEPRYQQWSWLRRLLFRKIAAEQMDSLGYRLD
jgi:hypothetical protein